jgi:hypothetical protein
MEYETLNSSSEKKLKEVKSYDRDDFSSMLIDLIKKINFKVAIFLFFLGIFIFSDIFIDIVLNKFNDAVDGNEPTTKGTIIQLLFITISYMAFDLLVQGEIL